MSGEKPMGRKLAEEARFDGIFVLRTNNRRSRRCRRSCDIATC